MTIISWGMSIPKMANRSPLSSPTTTDSASSEPDSLEDEQMDELADEDDDNEVTIVEVRNDDEVEIVEGQKLQETMEIGQGDDLAQTGGKLGKGKEKAVEDQGEPRI